MSVDLFDPARLRNKWAPAEPKRASTAAPSHPKLIEVVAPLDSLEVAQGLLIEIRERAWHELPEQRALLTPFFEQAERELGELVTAGEGVDLASLAQSTLLTLDRLEDLLEAFYLLIPRLK